MDLSALRQWFQRTVNESETYGLRSSELERVWGVIRRAWCVCFLGALQVCWNLKRFRLPPQLFFYPLFSGPHCGLWWGLLPLPAVELWELTGASCPGVVSSFVEGSLSLILNRGLHFSQSLLFPNENVAHETATYRPAPQSSPSPNGDGVRSHSCGTSIWRLGRAVAIAKAGGRGAGLSVRSSKGTTGRT